MYSKKKWYSQIWIFAGILLCFLIAPVHAEASFTIQHFNMEMDVLENGEVKITQTIYVDFHEEAQGLQIEIPTQWTTDVQYGKEISSVKHNVSIKNIHVEEQLFKTKKQDQRIVITIGDKDTTVYGKMKYTLTYVAALNESMMRSLDALYFNLLPTKWNTTIDSASFVIHMPTKLFDNYALQFLIGEENFMTSGTPGFSYEIIEQTIIANMLTPLEASARVVLRMPLPENYFKFPLAADFTLVISGISIVLMIACLLLFLRFGKDHRINKRQQQEIPKGLTCAALSYIVDEEVQVKDILALIIEWANAGYLTLEEIDENDIVLTKLMDMSAERRRYEQRLFRSLFAFGPVVKVSELRDTFYQSIQKAQKEVIVYYSQNKGRRVFYQSSVIFRIVCSLMAIFPTSLGLGYALFRSLFDITTALLVSVVFAIAGIFIIVLGHYLTNKHGILSIVKKAALSICAGLLTLLYYALYTTLMFWCMQSTLLIVSGILSSFMIALSALFMRKRTVVGRAWYEEIAGLQEFMMHAKQEQLDELMSESPQYFYRMLPYAYVLQISDVWAKRFNPLIVESAIWYQSDELLKLHMFMPRFYRVMSTLYEQLYHMPLIQTQIDDMNKEKPNDSCG